MCPQYTIDRQGYARHNASKWGGTWITLCAAEGDLLTYNAEYVNHCIAPTDVVVECWASDSPDHLEDLLP